MKSIIKSIFSCTKIFYIALSVIAISLLSMNFSFASSNQMIMGSGSSFIYPAMSKWTNKFYDKTGTEINYQPIGSGGGQRQIFNSTVYFAASDQPLTSKALRAHNLMQFPAIIGGIVPVINIPGIKSNEMVLSGKVLAQIYLHKIKYWDNSQIVKLNPKIKLSHNMIIAIHRADGSGTTYNFTKYLSIVSNNWEKVVGSNTSVQWPGGIGAKGNQGVAVQVQQIPNSIGYVEYAYAKTTNIPTVKLINKSGNAVEPNLTSFASSAKHADWKPKNDYNTILVNQPGKNSWPIVATTFILISKQNYGVINNTIKSFFKFAYSSVGSNVAASLDYVGIPKVVVTGIESYLSN